MLEQLAQLVLPKEILERFLIVKIETDEADIDAMSMTIHLDERINKAYQENSEYESLGFMEAVSVTDFPIRDHKVVLKLRRRRWKNKQTGESFVEQFSVTEKGTRYSKEFAAFLKETYGDIPGNFRTHEDFYHIDRHAFEKQYKEVLSGYREWNQFSHAEEWLLFPENTGERLTIDESSLSNGELYTFVTNRDAKTRKGSLVAVVSGTKSEDVIAVLERIDEDKLNQVKEVTLDLSDSMRRIIINVFPNA